MSENFFINTALPSITGLDASAPIAPSPKTAVPLLITATRLPRAVTFDAFRGSSTMYSQACATPGEYAIERSACVSRGVVALTSSFPGFPSM